MVIIVVERFSSFSPGRGTKSRKDKDSKSRQWARGVVMQVGDNPKTPYRRGGGGKEGAILPQGTSLVGGGPGEWLCR